MAVLSTVPSFAAGGSGSCASSAKFLRTVRAAASASADARARGLGDKQPQAFILSTEEVEVCAGEDKASFISVSVPCFCAKPKATKPTPRSGLSGPQRTLTKPPGLHIRPPPGLTFPASDQDSSFQPSRPPPQMFSPSLSLSTERRVVEEGMDDGDELDDIFKIIFERNSYVEDAFEKTSACKAPALPVLLSSRPPPSSCGKDASEKASACNATPLPVLLSSRPQPSMLGSSPFYGAPLPRKVASDQKIQSGVQPLAPGEVVEVRC